MVTIVFRVDASSQIGTGHLMRCLTLADSLKQRGAQTCFVSRHMPEHSQDMLIAKGHEFKLLNSSPSKELLDKLSHTCWLGTSQQADAQDTIQTLSSQTLDWLIVDHYALDIHWESMLRQTAKNIMVIDDLADRGHNCDLLLDQNLVEQMHTRYVARVPAACRLLLGPEYALLQPIYAELRDRTPPREGPVRRILIFFGGADSGNLTGRALTAFLSLNRPDIEVDVVITTTNPNSRLIRQQITGHGNIRLHSNLPTLAPLIVKADLAIGASGATSWERLCLGLPALIVTFAENQHPIAAGLSKQGLICWLGHQDMVDQTTIAHALGKLVQHNLDENWSRNCNALVDGKGVNRVCAALILTAATPLHVRHATLADETLLLMWANDSTTRHNAFSPDLISGTTHRIWFHSRLRNVDGCCLYIVETADGVPIGQVRFEREDLSWEIDYALAPIFRGCGLGQSLLKSALLKFRTDIPGVLVFGQVKADNHPSRMVFESLGFESRLNQNGEAIEYHCVL